MDIAEFVGDVFTPMERAGDHPCAGVPPQAFYAVRLGYTRLSIDVI